MQKITKRLVEKLARPVGLKMVVTSRPYGSTTKVLLMKEEETGREVSPLFSNVHDAYFWIQGWLCCRFEARIRGLRREEVKIEEKVGIESAVDASDLGLKPGEWPEWLEVNGSRFCLQGRLPVLGARLYVSPNGDRLVVAND